MPRCDAPGVILGGHGIQVQDGLNVGVCQLPHRSFRLCNQRLQSLAVDPAGVELSRERTSDNYPPIRFKFRSPRRLSRQHNRFPHGSILARRRPRNTSTVARLSRKPSRAVGRTLNRPVADPLLGTTHESADSLDDEHDADDRHESLDHPYWCTLSEWVENNPVRGGTQLRCQNKAHQDEHDSRDDCARRVRCLEKPSLLTHALIEHHPSVDELLSGSGDRLTCALVTETGQES